MAIQFFCTSCGQPIEVDDNMADLAVTCPYCQKVVTAPRQTDLTGRPQAASGGVGAGGEAIAPPGGPAMFAPGGALPTGLALGPPPRRTIVGWISLACILLAAVVVLYASVATWLLVKDLNLDPGSMTPNQMQQFGEEMQKRAAERPGLRIASAVGGCVLPVAALIMAIAALVTGGRPRWPAITTLVILGAGICLMCAGLLLRGAMPGGGG